MRCRGTGHCGPDLENSHDDHHTRHNPLGQDALFTTPASLMLDARLRHWAQWLAGSAHAALWRASAHWQTWGSCAAISPPPLWGRGPGTRRPGASSLMLRLTGWISLVGQHPRPSDRPVLLSELYQVHESALHFQQACALDASLPALRRVISAENNQSRSGGRAFEATLAQAPELLPLRPTINSAMTMICPRRRRRRQAKQPTHCHCLAIRWQHACSATDRTRSPHDG